jgi:uncharacterized protein YeaO (DUF488 family)
MQFVDGSRSSIPFSPFPDGLDPKTLTYARAPVSKGTDLIKVKRIYEPAILDDGFRVLVDRLWPRGLSKDRARVDLWMKEIAPSNELRRWFSHEPKKWNGFKKKYGLELRKKPELLIEIKRAEKVKGTVTLLYSAKDEEHNQAVALSAILRET